MTRKPYTPVASYTELKRVEGLIDRAKTVEEIRKLVFKDGPKIGYKAFCYILGGRMTPEGMKADEACVAAVMLEQQDKEEEAMDIYKKVLEVYPEHPIAQSKVSET